MALVLQQLVGEVPIGTAGATDLHTALSNLVKLVPSLNTLEDRLGNALEDSIRESFGNDDLDVDVVIGFVDYDGDTTTQDRAVVVGLKLTADDLIKKTLTPKLPITADFGALQLTSDPPPILHLHVGGSINLGLGVVLPNPNGSPPTGLKTFLLVADPTTGVLPHDQKILAGLKTRLDLNVGFDGRVSGNVKFGSLELIEAKVGLSLLKSVKDENVAVNSGVVNLSKVPSTSDGRFVIVTDPLGEVMSWNDYHFTLNPANKTLTFTTMPSQ